MRLRWLLPVLLLPVLGGFFLSQVSFRSGEQASVVGEKNSVSTKDSGHEAKTVAERSREKHVSVPVEPERAVTRTVPVNPSPLDKASDEEVRRFPGAKVLDAAEVAGPGPIS